MASQPVYYVTYVNPAGGAGPPPPPQYLGAGVHLAHAAAPQYPGPGVHVANPPATQPPGPSTSGGRPPPPPYAGVREQNANPPAPPYPGPGINHDDDGGDRSNNKHPRNGPPTTTAVRSESRKRKWALFLAGNLISIAVVVSEIAELNVCFDENLSEDDDTPEENAETTYGSMMFLLVLGLWIDVFSAIALSAIYHSPLDIKSAHKVPPGDMRHCGGTVMINFLAPFSWGLVYLVGGVVSVNYSQNSPCGGGAGGSGLERYLSVSAGLMIFISFAMLLLSVVMLLAACCSSSTQEPHRLGTPPPPRGCCTRIRETLHKRVLSTGPIFDLGWQLQGVALSYRVGAFSLSTALLVGASGVFGELLAAFGSFAPDEVQELLGPIIV